MAIGRIPEPGTGIPESIVDAKGDIVTATAADTPARLAVGTNEHRLVADSGETTGLKYVADTTNYAVAAKGDLLVGTAADTVAVLSVGTNGHTLVADSGETTGLKWAAPASLTLLSTTTLSGSSVTVSSISTSYTNLQIFIKDAYSSGDADLYFRLNSDSGANQYQYVFINSNGSAAGQYSQSANTQVQLGFVGSSTGFNQKTSALLNIPRYTDTSNISVISSLGAYAFGNYWNTQGYSKYNASAAITAFTLYPTSGTFSGGTIYIYGVK